VPLVDVVSENLVTLATALPLTVPPLKSCAFDAIVKTAARFPIACGLKVMVIEHEPFAGIGAVQVLVCEKSPGLEPVNVMPLTVSGAVASIALAN
jgi:hypothetical protein